MATFLDQFKAARSRGVPLIGVTTPDPDATMARLCGTLKPDVPALQWDCVRGIVARNKAGVEALAAARIDGAETPMIVDALVAAQKLPEGSVLFMLNAHLFTEPMVVQGVWNLRDSFKSSQPRARTLVLMAPSLRLAPELEHDVIVLDEPLPTRDEIRAIVTDVYDSADGVWKKRPKQLDDATLTRVVDALTGLSAFACEQITAICLTAEGIDVDGVWDRKRRAVEQTPGLSVWRGGESLADVAGYENAKLAVRRLRGSRKQPRAIVFIDEIEKLIGGAGTDTSGVSQDQLAQLLTYMQDKRAEGMIFIGPPGAGKTAIAKAAGTELGIPTIALDLGGMKDSLVGSSEGRIRAALKVVSAVAEDAAMFIATCNSIGSLPPELRRRFTAGTFFFDLPKAAERAAIWSLYMGKYELTAEQTAQRPHDEGWTGAEIAQCVARAWNQNLTLVESAAYVVPVAISAERQIEALREGASGRFISASEPGLYKWDRPLPAIAAADGPRRRAITDTTVN